MSLNAWLGFFQEFAKLDKKVVGARTSDPLKRSSDTLPQATGDFTMMRSELHNIFISTKDKGAQVQDDKTKGSNTNSQAIDASDTGASMMRFEFFEGLVRVSLSWSSAIPSLSSPSLAFEAFIKNVITPHLPSEALLDTNVWRKEKMYNKEMETALQAHWDILEATYNLYKDKYKAKFALFPIEAWEDLLSGTQLMEHAKIDRRKARWFFITSLMATVDDLKVAGRASSLPLFDFIEALCKVSESVKSKGAANGSLVGHFEAMMEWLQVKLANLWGGTDEDSVAHNMQRVGGMNKLVKKKKSGEMQVASVKGEAG